MFVVLNLYKLALLFKKPVLEHLLGSMKDLQFMLFIKQTDMDCSTVVFLCCYPIVIRDLYQT